MLVGQSVRSCPIALALCSFVTVLATGTTLAMELCSGAKLHWRVTISPMLPNGNWHSNSVFHPTSVILSSSGKSRSNLFGHFHSQLQVCRPLAMYPSLSIPLQAVDEMEESFCIIDITILREPLTKAHNIVGYVAMLHPFVQGLTHFERIVCWLEVRQ